MKKNQIIIVLIAVAAIAGGALGCNSPSSTQKNNGSKIPVSEVTDDPAPLIDSFQATGFAAYTGYREADLPNGWSENTEGNPNPAGITRNNFENDNNCKVYVITYGSNSGTRSEAEVLMSEAERVPAADFRKAELKVIVDGTEESKDVLMVDNTGNAGRSDYYVVYVKAEIESSTIINYYCDFGDDSASIDEFQSVLKALDFTRE